MVCRNLSNLLLCVALAFSSGIASTDAAPFVARTSRSNPLSSPAQQALSQLRGGAVDSGKALTKLGLVVGTATTLSTKTVLGKIGMENVDPVTSLTARRIGGDILTYSIIAYCLLAQDTSVSTAVGVGGLPIVIELALPLVDGTCKELGIPAGGQAVAVAIHAAFCYFFLNGGSSEGLLKLFCGWMCLNGTFLGFLPKLACKFWGDLDASTLSTLQKVVSVWGFAIISVGALSGLLATGNVTTERALALGAIPFLFRLVLSIVV